MIFVCFLTEIINILRFLLDFKIPACDFIKLTIMLDREDFGKFYVSLPRGQKGRFIAIVCCETTGSYNTWRNRFMDWSRGNLDGKSLPIIFRREIEKIIAEFR